MKKLALIFSMIILSYIGDGSGDYRSFFASWFIFFVLIVIDYLEMYNFKRIQEKQMTKLFYFFGVIIFGVFSFFFLLGSIGLIQVKDSIIKANEDFIIVKGLFLLDSGNILTLESLIYSIAVLVVIFTVLEFFTKPLQSYKEKHMLKQSNRREVS